MGKLARIYATAIFGLNFVLSRYGKYLRRLMPSGRLEFEPRIVNFSNRTQLSAQMR
jgi:hypothetical protein